jgi:DNA-binding GntR family transcriptional regulator
VTVSENRMDQTRYTEFMTLPGGADAHRQIVQAVQSRNATEVCRLISRHLDEIEASLDLSAPPDNQTSLSAVLANFAPIRENRQNLEEQ